MSRIAIDAPQFLALIPCERTSKNEETGQWNIHGTFDQMQLEKYPALVPQFYVYIAVGKGGSSKQKETVNLALISPTGQIVIQSLIYDQLEYGPDRGIGTDPACRDFPNHGQLHVAAFRRGLRSG